MAHRTLLLFFAALLLASVCRAEDRKEPPPTARAGGTPQLSFAYLDQNHDKRLTRSEAAAIPELAFRFREIDLDGDHAVSEAEYEQWRSETYAARR